MSGAAIAAEVALAYAEAGRDAGDGLGAVYVTITGQGSPRGRNGTLHPARLLITYSSPNRHPRHTLSGLAWHWVRVSWSIRW